MWSAAVGTASWLALRQMDAMDAVAIAETRSHRVATAELGRLLSVEVAEGQRVRAGQVVAYLESTTQNEISVAESRFQHASSTIGASPDVNLLQSERALVSEIEAAEIERHSAHAGYARDSAELAQLSEESKHERNMIRRGLAKSDRLPPIEMRHAAMDEAVRNWPARIAAIEARHAAAVARLNEWRRANTAGPSGSRNAQLRPPHDRAAEQRQAVRSLRSRLEQTILRASADGYVSEIHARPGSVLNPGDVVVSVVETEPHAIMAYIEEHRASRLAIGTPVIVHRRNGSRDAWSGTVTAIAGEVGQMPRRLWFSPSIPAWGRAVYIHIPASANLDAGEMLNVAAKRSGGAVEKIMAMWRGKDVVQAR